MVIMCGMEMMQAQKMALIKWILVWNEREWRQDLQRKWRKLLLKQQFAVIRSVWMLIETTLTACGLFIITAIDSNMKWAKFYKRLTDNLCLVHVRWYNDRSAFKENYILLVHSHMVRRVFQSVHLYDVTCGTISTDSEVILCVIWIYVQEVAHWRALLWLRGVCGDVPPAIGFFGWRKPLHVPVEWRQLWDEEQFHLQVYQRSDSSL